MVKPLSKLPLFSKKQQKGILFLVFLIIFFQVLIWYYQTHRVSNDKKYTKEELIFLANQQKLDSLIIADSSSGYKIYPFNPNFISDFKGYQLGMNISEIDRLHKFRAQNKYVNSAKEFQEVTHISDSLLNSMKEFFKFPDWVSNKNNQNKNSDYKPYSNKYIDYSKNKNEIEIKDINFATAEDFMNIPGIGEAFANRIITERDKYKGFLSLNQVDDIWGLSPAAIQNLKKYFKIQNITEVPKLKINDASINEISKLPYLRYSIAKEIVIFRSKFGDFKSINDLEKVNTFPIEKKDILKLYIEF